MKNELIHGDALTILPTLPANSFDALITDPPYASGGVHAAARQRSPNEKYMQSSRPYLHADFPSDERDQRSHLAWMQLWLAQCHRFLRDGAPEPPRLGAALNRRHTFYLHPRSAYITATAPSQPI